jgi:GntR family transcriptional regulator
MILPSELVEAGLRARLEAGEWLPGDQLPALDKLGAEYGASKETVARVERKLADEGLLFIRARWGVFRV